MCVCVCDYVAVLQFTHAKLITRHFCWMANSEELLHDHFLMIQLLLKYYFLANTIGSFFFLFWYILSVHLANM